MRPCTATLKCNLLYFGRLHSRLAINNIFMYPDFIPTPGAEWAFGELLETRSNNQNAQLHVFKKLSRHIRIRDYKNQFAERAWMVGCQIKDALGTAGGLLSYWDIVTYDGSLLNKGRYSITIKLICKSTGFTWMLSNIYGPHNQ